MGRHDRRPEEATLAAIFDGITATAEGVDRLETCEDWRPYVVADIPEPVTVRPVPAERKTGTVRALGPWILAGSVLGKTA